MALRVNNTATVDFATAAGWDGVSNTPTLHASTNLQITAGPFYSAVFTAPNITGNKSTGCAVWLCLIGTVGPNFTATLQEYSGVAWGDVAGATATINIATYLKSWVKYDLYVQGSALTNVVYFRWTTPYAYAKATAGYYRIKITNSGYSGTTTLRTDSGAANFAFMETNDITGLATTDDCFVLSPNAASAVTCTVSGTQYVGSGAGVETQYPGLPSTKNALTIGGLCSLVWDNSTSSTLIHKGNIVTCPQATFTMDSHTDATKVLKCISVQPTASGDYGVRLVGNQGHATVKGVSKIRSTKYVSGTGTALDPLVTAINIGEVGDEIMVCPTGNSTINYRLAENMIIYAKPTSTSYELVSVNLFQTGSGTVGGSGGFESRGNYLAGWTNSLSTGDTVADETVVVHAGGSEHALKMIGGATHTGAYYCYISQTYQGYNIVPGQTLTLSFWTQGDGTNAGFYRISDASNGGDIKAKTTTGVTGAAYGQVTWDFTVPANCYTVNIYFYVPNVNAGFCYFDDATLTYTAHGLQQTHTADAWVLNTSSNVILTSDNHQRGNFVIAHNMDAGNLVVSDVRMEYSGSSTYYKEGFVPCRYADGYASVDNVVCYAPVTNGFYLTGSGITQTFSNLIACNGTLSGAYPFAISSIKNLTINDSFAVNSYYYLYYITGCANLNFNRCVALGGNTSGTAAYGSWMFYFNALINLVDCEAHCNRTSGLNFGGANPSSYATRFLCGTKGHNQSQDIYVRSDFPSTFIFKDSTFGSTTFVSNYLNATAGTSLQFDRIQDTDDQHLQITNGGKSDSIGAGLPDSNVRTTGNLAVGLSPESLTVGQSTQFKISQKPNTMIKATGYVYKNGTMGSDVVKVELFLYGSTVADYSYTMTAASIGAYAPWMVYAYNTNATPRNATVKITALSATPGAKAYVADIYEGTNAYTSYKTWEDGLPAPMLPETLGDAVSTASAVWAALTSGFEFNTAGMVGKKLVDCAETDDVIAFK